MPIAERLRTTPTEQDADPRTDDDALVRRMQAGDEESFATLFAGATIRRCSPTAGICSGNQDEGEDALQQAFIKAHQSTARRDDPHASCVLGCTQSRVTAACRRSPQGGGSNPARRSHAGAREGLSDQVYQREDLRELVARHRPPARGPAQQRCCWPSSRDLSHQEIAHDPGVPGEEGQGTRLPSAQHVTRRPQRRATHHAWTSVNNSRWHAAANFAVAHCADI